MPGPAPKSADQRRRRNAVPSSTRLPAGGRNGGPPVWPLPNQTPAEVEVWAALWVTPQAVAWERLGWARSVARYCRFLVQSEAPDASSALLAEVRQMEDRLGLSPMAMLRLRWEIDTTDELAEKRDEATPRTRRVKAVDLRAVAGA